MRERASPAWQLLSEVRELVSHANQLGILEDLAHYCKCAKEVLVAFAQADRADTNEPWPFRQSRPWIECGRVHAVRIQDALRFRQAVVEHGFEDKLRRTENEVGPLQFTVCPREHPARNGNFVARAKEITFPLPEAVKAGRMTARRINHLQRASSVCDLK